MGRVRRRWSPDPFSLITSARYRQKREEPAVRLTFRRSGWALLALVLVGCSTGSRSASGGPQTTSTNEASAIPSTFTLPAPRVVVDGLNQPTQFLTLPDGRLVVAQLNGDENAKTGQIVSADPVTGAIEILAEHLDKPTGVALLDGWLWIMERRRISRIPWSGLDAPPAERRVVLDDLPFNGRSSGTLTPLDGTTLLYDTSGDLAGSIDAGRVTAGSGRLHALDTRTLESRVVATGTKHAYSHWVLSPKHLLTTEILDGPGVHPSDELNLVDPTEVTDLGWPKCPADLPTKAGCERYVPPLAVFPANSTPTAVVESRGYAYVALFASGTIVRLPITDWKQGDASKSWTVVASGLQGPLSMVLTPDRELLVSEHFTGRILRYLLQ